jgi:hypothetical protein
MSPAGAGTNLVTTLLVIVAAEAGLGTLVNQPVAGGVIGPFVALSLASSWSIAYTETCSCQPFGPVAPRSSNRWYVVLE